MTVNDGDGGEGAIELLIPPLIDPDRLRGDPSLQIRNFGGDTMGTSWSVVAALWHGADIALLRQRIGAGFASIVGQMSQWEPTSELSRFNAAPTGSWHEISPQFALVAQAALSLGEASGGAFDPTLGHVTDAWGFGASGAPERVPDAAALAAARRDGLRLNAKARRLFQPGGLALDLSGIAKGFAVDHALATLGAEGVRHALVEIGGELRGAGVRPDGEPWWVDLEPVPGAPAASPVRIALSNWAVATSGHYLRRREAGGQNWSHSIDPVTARPTVDDVMTVSVLHPQCMMADGLATVIAVMGREAGIAFADHHRVAARIVCPDATICSSAWIGYCA